MSRKETKRIKRGYGALKNPVYLNANLIYSEALNFLKGRKEVIQNLRLNNSLNIDKARKIYKGILERYKILEITGLDKKCSLTDAFMDGIAKRNLTFKDALHLTVARNHNDMPVCTHDKKMRGDYGQHSDKKKFYEYVYKPEELIKTKPKKS